jgi:hypothetical protein
MEVPVTGRQTVGTAIPDTGWNLAYKALSIFPDRSPCFPRSARFPAMTDRCWRTPFRRASSMRTYFEQYKQRLQHQHGWEIALDCPVCENHGLRDGSGRAVRWIERRAGRSVHSPGRSDAGTTANPRLQGRRHSHQACGRVDDGRGVAWMVSWPSTVTAPAAWASSNASSACRST